MNIKQFSIIFSSDPASGAQNVSSGPNNAGSIFSVQLDQNPIHIPKEAKSCTLFCPTATFWWTILNIVTGVNDGFQFAILAGPNAGTYTVTVPQGIYNLTSLAGAINIQLLNVYPALPANPITFTADQSTQRVILVFNIDNVQVNFRISNSMRNILGFYGTGSLEFPTNLVIQDYVPDPATYPTGSFVNQAIYANQVANFNTINSLLINSPQLGPTGIATNGVGRNTICNPSITVAVGQQNVFTPILPPYVNADHLIGKTTSNLKFSLTDQNGNAVNTNGETWSVTVTFVITF